MNVPGAAFVRFFSLIALGATCIILLSCSIPSGGKVDDSTSIHITYNGSGSSGGAEPIDNNDYITGQTATVLDNTGNLVNSESAFGGWNTATNGSGTTYSSGNTLTIGSENITLYAVWLPASLIISEVGDPIDGGMFVELYNATSVPINLDGWKIRTYTNGNVSVTNSTALTDFDLGSGATFVVVNNISDFLSVYPEDTFGCYPEMVGGSITGTGNDVYELFDGIKTVDIYGVVNDEEYEIWNYHDCVVQRLPEVIHGTDNFNISEWYFGDEESNLPASPGSRFSQ